MKTFTTAAFTLNYFTLYLFVRILKDELFASIDDNIVQLGAHECRKCFTIDDDLDVVLLDYIIKSIWFSDVIYAV
jgi:hypothetical protein